MCLHDKEDMPQRYGDDEKLMMFIEKFCCQDGVRIQVSVAYACQRGRVSQQENPEAETRCRFLITDVTHFCHTGESRYPEYTEITGFRLAPE